MRRQLRASSGGSSDARSKASFPLYNTEARQHQRNLDVTSDVVLSCRALSLVLNQMITGYFHRSTWFDTFGRISGDILVGYPLQHMKNANAQKYSFKLLPNFLLDVRRTHK